MSRRKPMIVSAMVMAALLTGSTVTARAVEITFFCAGALQTTAEELLPEFQRGTGHNVRAVFTSIGFITQRVRNGELADLAIVSPQTLSRELRAMGYRKLSARPRHHAQAPGAVEAFKTYGPPRRQAVLSI